MDNVTLTRLALLPTEALADAVEDLVKLLMHRGMTEAEVEHLEQQVHQVNTSLDQWRRPH
jgi:hypothetical protein